jgi:copper oxidase (laccase) domain-containing protein
MRKRNSMVERESETGLHVIQSELLLEAGLSAHGWFDASMPNTMHRPHNPYNDETWMEDIETYDVLAEGCDAIGAVALNLVRTRGLLQTNRGMYVNADHAYMDAYQKATLDGGCDIFFTNKKNVPITIQTADCVPAILYAPHKALSVAHAGGMGTSKQTLTRAVYLLDNCNVEPDEIFVALGPAIRDNYSPTKQRDGYTLEDISASKPVTHTVDGVEIYDIIATSVRQLQEAGVPSAQIDISTCLDTRTATNEDGSFRFYSYDRDFPTTTYSEAALQQLPPDEQLAYTSAIARAMRRNATIAQL